MPDFRLIPSIEQMRQRPRVHALETRYGHDAIVEALRAAANDLRGRMSDPASGPADAADAGRIIEDAIEAGLRRVFHPSLQSVINATGVIIHTNLGRAPLAAAAARHVAALAAGYSNLEYELSAGHRGSRDRHAEPLLCRLTGAEAAVVVNNNAAATLIVLAALASGREAVISRGELVEIGGGFRVPDVMAQSGVVLREVGTTNKTRANDYAAALSDRTALLLRVHPSNFRVEGFTERPRLEELVALGKRFNVIIAEDLGSGHLLGSIAEAAPWLREEPTVQASLEAGADLVWFSGDKLLGGPQCGIIAGRAHLVSRVRTHPLMRALRVDKLTYAALEATLLEYLGGRAEQHVPVARMMVLTPESIETRALGTARALRDVPGIRTAIVDGVSTLGGGSAPGAAIPTRLLVLTVDGLTPDALEERLRALDPPVIARIEQDRVVLDLRTVLPDQDEVLARLLHSLSA